MTQEFDYANCDEKSLWRHVAWHLHSHGYSVVLVGGAAGVVHSGLAFRSGDLDLLIERGTRAELNAVLIELGFRLDGRHLAHPHCPHLIVEWVYPPLGIGASTDVQVEEQPYRGQVLQVLSPTDAVCDRLASAIHFHARDCMLQAELIVRNADVDLDRVRCWCEGEGPGGREAFDDLGRRLGRD